MELNVFSVVLLVSGLTVAGISSVLISQVRGSIRWFAITMVAVSVWAMAYGFELASLDLESMLFWVKIEYLGIALAPATWFWFCLSYSGLQKFTKKFYWILVFSIPLITLSLVWTNEWHGLYYAQTSVDPSGPFPMLDIRIGPWYYVHIGYFYISLFAGNAILLAKFKNVDPVYRRQTYLLIMAGFFPWFFNLFYMFGYRPFGHIDLTPFSFLLLYIIVGFALLKYRLFDFKPIVRDTIIESLDKGILVVDPKNRIIDYNPFIFSLLELPKRRLIGRKISDLFQDHEEIEKNLASQKSGKTEIIQAKSGELKHLQLSLSPIYSKNHNYLGSVLTFDDISEDRKTAEQIKKQAEELKDLNQLKDKLFSIISHDLKGPIFGLKELIKMTRSGLVSQEEFFDLMPEISKNLDSVSILMENLLAWTSTQMQGEYIAKKQFDLGSLMDQHLELFRKFAQDKDISIRLEKEGNLQVFADRNMIDLIIRNLLSNAIKFCSKGDQILLSATEQVNTVFIQVIDTGAGMTPENLDKLKKGISFTTFGKNKEKGTGLGMVLVRDYIVKNGGVLNIASELNKGSAFSFSLPKKNPEII
ncbi:MULTISPECIES: sensor histidine kinase [Cecembia]|uniref:histidine kinase n=1 Tax=Cecembia calidifontis TaxID=1187080 RepID=A0A4Q7PDR4_9BACT|nr:MULTISPECIES: histidine kinase N-terminal 7TM domain-containing protein [Cecembia]RZS98526.1 PAS domain S-box-containing protein [Cecembia calidifontis]